MLDSILIGATIANYRKQQNLTQLELADYMHVTPQAVSKWETGKSLPDIYTMIKLAKLLHIDIAMLLGENTELSDELLHQFAPGQTTQMPLHTSANSVQIDAIIALEDEKSSFSDDLQALTLAQIIQLAPLVDQETLIHITGLHADSLAENAKALTELAPFLTEDALYAIVCGDDPLTIDHILTVIRIAPYYDERLHQYVSEHQHQITIQQMSTIAPFIAPDQLQSFVTKHWQQYTNQQKLAEILSLLPEPAVAELLMTQEITYELLLFVIPFIDQALVNHLIEHKMPLLQPEQLAIIRVLVNVNSL
ncbi:helix-turn-helix transcriptional regulator [Paenibacillus hunanensis]|uniref:helix-turn-helix domain-containing protein n=1 Tax=Paenibacillus hunanensis TaxID=539262 RepID=UPI002A6AFB0A|nr:helix-turn-helix transcriptional regulator [Paenibacillus hunanensis]WPP43452.1 helix-turn-helix transcriptional regulator [Paenibacillus hunanensis]